MAEHHAESSSTAATNSGAESGLVKAVKFMTDVGVKQVEPALVENLQKVAPSIVTAFGIPVDEGGHAAPKAH